MKISLISDLHLDMGGPITLPGGEVLIIAGDTCEAKSLNKETQDSKHYSFPIKQTEACYYFFNCELSKYEKVFYVLGNHEHYRGRFDKTLETMRNLMPSNVTILENECVEYNDVMFMGATLWTDCNKSDPLTIHDLKMYMNDYNIISNHYVNKNQYYKLQPEVTINEHKKTLEYFRNILSKNPDKKFVVITHHAPSLLSINEKYKDDYRINGGYASDLSHFILDNPNIKVWVHGHMHDPVSYELGVTRVYANPRGYIPYEANNGFNPAFYFEV